MDTGSEPSRRGNLYSWNYTSISTAFRGECGAINGSAGELFNADLGRDGLSFYSSDMCRTLTVPFEKETDIYGLKVNRYAATEVLFASPEINPENWCNCHGECPPSGLLDQSHCRHGMQSFVSLPHMLFADPRVVNETEGQHADPGRHKFLIDVEPMTGTPVSVRARFQINLLLKPSQYVSVLADVPTVHMPVIWFETSADTTPALAAKFQTITVTLPVVLGVSSWALAVLGALALAVAAVLYLRQRRLSPGSCDVTGGRR